MKWEYFGTGLALLGIGITMVLALPPPWWPSMPRGFVRAGLFIGLAFIIYGTAFTAMGIWPDELRPKLLPIVAMCLGLSIFIAGSIWFSRMAPPRHEAETSPLDGTIQVSAEPANYPTVASNKMYEMEMATPIISEGVVLVSFIYSVGTTFPARNPDILPFSGWRFRITNYGKTAVINTHIPFRVEFYPNTEKSKKYVVSRAPPFSIAPGESIDMYAMNYSTDTEVSVSAPEIAEGFVPGGTKPETFKLIPSLITAATIPPFTPKSLPALSHPAPAPPNKPEEK